VREAKLLLEGSEWSGAYYLAGYAIECGVKACLAKDFRPYHMPDKEIVTKGHIHDIDTLTRLANLDGPRGLNAQADPDFAVKWAVAASWNESSRYATWTETQAKELYEAVTNMDHGVLPWLKQYW
jgi:hypothetical protein